MVRHVQERGRLEGFANLPNRTRNRGRDAVNVSRTQALAVVGLAVAELGAVLAGTVTTVHRLELERAERQAIKLGQAALLDALTRELRRAAGLQGGGPLDLAAVTTFGRKELWVFRPYSWPDLVEERLGFSWGGGLDSATAGNDWHRLLVFTDGSRVVMWLDFPLIDGEFDFADDLPVWRENAKLRVWDTPRGAVITRWGSRPSIHRFVHYNSKGKIEELTPEELKKREARVLPRTTPGGPRQGAEVSPSRENDNK